MQEAQLTHGAFYAHFSSKHGLYKEAITAATKNSILAKAQAENSCVNINLTKLIAAYLSIEHVQQKSPPFHWLFLPPMLPIVKRKYVWLTPRSIDLITILNKQLNHTPSSQERMLALSALMIGGVAISRALCDEQAVMDLLGACRKYGEKLLDTNIADT